MIYLRPNKQLTFNSFNKMNFKTAEILLKGIVCVFPCGFLILQIFFLVCQTASAFLEGMLVNLCRIEEQEIGRNWLL